MNAKRGRGSWLPFVAGLFLSAGACSYGAVQDAATGDFLGAAQVEFRVVVPPSSVPADHLWAPVELGDSYVSRTWSADDPGSNGVQGIYYLNPAASDGMTDPRTRIVQGGWNAVVVSRSGYDTRRLYRNHLYRRCLMGKQNPYSAGPFPLVSVDTSDPSQVEEGFCARQDFSLDRTGTSYDKAPDLIIDPRSLLDRALGQCSRAVAPRTCLRVTTSTANVGNGDLLLVAPFTTIPPEDDLAAAEPVRQLIARSDGGVTEVGVGGQFFLQRLTNSHSFTSGERWITLRLRRHDPALCELEGDAGACAVEREGGSFIGECIYDATIFDSQYTPALSFGGCGLLTRFAHGGRLFHREGIGAGRASLHSSAAQIDVSDLPAGDYWLEAEVNAERQVVETDYDNNVARVQIQL